MKITADLTDQEAEFLDGAMVASVEFSELAGDAEGVEFMTTLAQKFFGENWDPFV